MTKPHFQCNRFRQNQSESARGRVEHGSRASDYRESIVLRGRPMTDRRTGFTMIELLVAVAIIAILISLLLPAVQAAREAARRSQCRSNLKQVALSAQNYHDIHNRFPMLLSVVYQSGFPCGPTKGIPGPSFDFNMHTWGSALLPYLGATTVYNRIDQNAPLFAPWDPPETECYEAENSGCVDWDPCSAARPLAAVIPTWVCPSAPRTVNPFTEKTQDWSDEWEPCFFLFTRLSGASDYFPICGFGGNLAEYYNYVSTGSPCKSASRSTDGVLEDSTGGHSLDEITDGASTTLFCTENAGRPDLWVLGKKVDLTCPTLNWREYTVTNTGGCWGCFGNAALNNFEGSTFTGAETTSNTEPVCFFNCTNLGGGTNLVYSFHSGCGGVAMCDGSAHMLNDKIDIRVMLGMVTFRGQEPIPDSAIGK